MSKSRKGLAQEFWEWVWQSLQEYPVYSLVGKHSPLSYPKTVLLIGYNQPKL